MYNRGMARSKAITIAHRRLVIEMFARGYTVRTIRKRLTAEMGREPSEQELLRLSVAYADDIDKARGEVAELALSRGLAVKAERVLRLGELAEEWEEGAKTDPKAAGVYLKTLDQINKEIEPLHIHINLPKDDPWVQLMESLRESARERPQLSPGTSDTAPVKRKSM